MTDARPQFSRVAWVLSLLGLGLSTFAVVALSGSGRIDNVAAQTRFDVGRSLVEHGDSILRDHRYWWGAYPGVDGKLYSYDRLPPCLIAAAAIRIADATGSANENRQQFIYTFQGAVASGLLSILYALWFRHSGCRPIAAIMWGAGGVFCTPAWYYGTSTFEESMGTTVLILALLAAAIGRGSYVGAIVAGLLIGLAYNFVPANGFFLLLAIALQDDSNVPKQQRFSNATMLVVGLLAGIFAEIAYNRFKFSADNSAASDQIRSLLYGADFANHQLVAAASLSVSFGVGALWYSPTLFLCFRGAVANYAADRKIGIALNLSVVGFFIWCCSRADFVGEIAGASWGPRLLTPVFTVLWLYAPAGAAKLRCWVVGALLLLGIGVQVLGLTVDPARLYIERDFSPSKVKDHPWIYFDTANSHLLNRPRELWACLQAAPSESEFSPSPSPTTALPLLELPDSETEAPPEFARAKVQQRLEKKGPEVVQQYRVLNSCRPWWICLTNLPSDNRPVNLGKSAALLLALLGTGLIAMGLSVRKLKCES